jgi:general secretion pathway protein G
VSCRVERAASFSLESVATGNHRRRQQGFTLIELLVVLAIIATLAAIVAPQIFRNVGDARTGAAKAQIEVFSLALDAYRLDNGSYPSTEQGLRALVERPAGGIGSTNWRGPYLKRDVPPDPWGHAYAYAIRPPPSEDYELYSLGRDGREAGTGEDADLTASGKPVHR